jgi:hypothetical protein
MVLNNLKYRSTRWRNNHTTKSHNDYKSQLGNHIFPKKIIFPREISSFSVGKIEISRKNGVSKLALKE